MGFDAGAGGLAHGFAEAGIFDKAVEGLGQGFRIGGRDEESGFAFGNLVGGAADVRADDGKAEAHGFHDHAAEGFGLGRGENEDVHGGVGGAGVGEFAGENDSIRETELIGELAHALEVVFGSGGGAAGDKEFDRFASGLELGGGLDEEFLAFAEKFEASDGSGDEIGFGKAEGFTGFLAFLWSDGVEFGKVDAVVEDFDFRGRGELLGDGAGDAEDFFREGEDVAGVGFPEGTKFLKPIADVPDVRDAGEAGGEGGVADDAGVGVDEGDIFFAGEAGEGLGGWNEAEQPGQEPRGAEDRARDDAESWKNEDFDSGISEQVLQRAVFRQEDDGSESGTVEPLGEAEKRAARAVDVRAVVDEEDFFQWE